MPVSSASAWLAGTGLTVYNPSRGTMPKLAQSFAPAPAPAAPAPTPPTTAGIEPQAFEAILYDHDMPLYVGGRILIGGRICEGPWFGGTPSDPTVSFLAFHAINIGSQTGSYGDTTVTEGRLRGQVVWDNGSYVSTDKLPSGKFDWRPGHYLQTPFFQSIGRFGPLAIPYRPGIISSWQDIPLKPFGGIVPFPSVKVQQTRYGDPADGIPRSEAIKRVLEWMRFEGFEFEVDVSGSEPAVLVASQTTLEDWLRQLRALYSNWEITWTDKLRILEPSGFTIGAALTNRNVRRSSLKFRRTDPMLIARETRYKYIDIDRDYEFNVAVAREDLQPIPTTDAVSSRTIDLPFATTAAQAVADVHVTHYQELAARFQMECSVDTTVFGIAAGDGVSYQEGVHDFVGSVAEAAHDFGTMTPSIKAVERLRCEGEGEIDPYIIYVVLLLDPREEADGSTTFMDWSEAAHGLGTVINDAVVDDGAVSCDGVDDGVYWASDADWVLSSSNSDTFTIEAFITPDTATPSDCTIVARHGGGVPNLSWMFWINASGELQLLGTTSGGSYNWSAFPTSSGITWQAGREYHVMVDKDALGKLRVYRDGVMLGSATPTDSAMSSPVCPLTVGVNGVSGGRSFAGDIRVRITKGIARCGSNAGYTVPAFWPRT